MPDTKPTLLSSEWYSTEETEKALGIARRTLQEWAQKGFLRWKMQTMAGRKPARVYQAEDVERLRKQGPPRAERPVEAVAARPKAALVRRESSMEVKRARLAIEEKRLAFEREKWEAERERARVAACLWLTLDESVAYTGLQRLVIRRAIGEGKLTAVKAGAWRVRRASLEAFAG